MALADDLTTNVALKRMGKKNPVPNAPQDNLDANPNVSRAMNRYNRMSSAGASRQQLHAQNRVVHKQSKKAYGGPPPKYGEVPQR